MKMNFKQPGFAQHASRSLFNHFTIISFILFMATLIYCVYSIEGIISTPKDEAYFSAQQSNNAKTLFDQRTIDAVNQLRTTDDRTPVSLPPGRINPFSE